MLYEPSTLASIAYLLGRTLEQDYAVDSRAVFAQANVAYQDSFHPGERIKAARMDALWAAAIAATADELIGITVGRNVEPAHFYAFGHSWLASESLLGAIRRLGRYDKIICTHASDMEIRKLGNEYVVTESYPDPASMPSAQAIDFGISAFLRMSEISAGRKVIPSLIEMTGTDTSHRGAYQEAFGTRVKLNAASTVVHFSKDDLESPLLGSIPEVAKATDRICEHYLETLDTSKTATKVRQLLIDYLPSGNAHQERVAQSLHRSASTLQRQLNTEGTSYREVLDNTRQSLAKEYLHDDKYTHAQIAYLLGFSDQSNFSRAFKRWYGVAPREFQGTHARD